MRYVFLFFGLVFSLQPSADVYKCTDAEGNKIYKAIPCADGQKKVELNVRTGSKTDLNAQETQQKLSKQEQEAKSAQKKQEEDEARQKINQLKQRSAEETAKNQFLVKSNPQKFSAFAIPPYQYDQLPPLVKSFQDRLPDVERMRRESAQKSLATGQCGRVESSVLSEKSNKQGLVFLVDCSSAKKFYFTERELNPEAAAPSAETSTSPSPATPTSSNADDAQPSQQPTQATEPAPAATATPQ